MIVVKKDFKDMVKHKKIVNAVVKGFRNTETPLRNVTSIYHSSQTI